MTVNVVLESSTVKTNSEMNVSFLTSGIYFVILGNKSEIFTEKSF